MRKHLLVLFLCLTAGLGRAQSFTANNTPACAGTPLPAYCTAAFTAMQNTADAGAQTVVVNPVPGNVSTLDIHNLLPAGTKVAAHFLPWFTSPGTGDHTQTKYNSNDANTVNAQMNAMIQLHLNGLTIDDYSQFNTTTDGTTQKIRDNLAARCSGPQNCPLEFAVTEDQGAVTRAQGTRAACALTDSACMQTSILQDVCYYNATYFGSNAYLKMNPTTKAWQASTNPVIGFFPPSSTTAWNTAVTNIKSLTAANGWAATNCPVGQQQANGGLLSFDSNTTNVAETPYNGGSSWVGTSPWSASNQFLIDGPTGNYHESLYSSCAANPGAICIGSAKKGFNDWPTPLSNPTGPFGSWGSNRITAQECGQTWVTTLRKSSNFTGSNLTLQLATWNDYEEGTEIETGISPCYTFSTAPTVTTNTISWAGLLGTTDATYAPLSAGIPTGPQVDHWKIWSVDGSGTVRTALDNIPLATTSEPFTALAVPANDPMSLYVQLVGQPDVLNVTSPASSTVTVVSPGGQTFGVGFSGVCTIQSLAAPGYTGADTARTNYPAYCPIPLADSDGVNPSLTLMGLDCVRSGGNCINNSFVPTVGQFKCWATYADGNCKLVIVDTLVTSYSGTAITGASESGTTATITTSSPHGLAVGTSVNIEGVGIVGYNGVYTVATVPTNTTFTYALPSGGLASSSGGTVYTNPQIQVNLTSGTGNFGGSSLARDGQDCAGTANANLICINNTGFATACGSAGATCWTIQKSNFDLFHKVTVNTTTLVDAATAASDGVVIKGPTSVNPDGTSVFNLSPAAPTALASVTTSTACTTNCPPLARTVYATISYASAHGETPDGPPSQTVNIAASPNGATESANTVTITTKVNHNLFAGESVIISGVGVTGYNGTFTVATVPTNTTFTYTDATSGLAASGGGTVLTGKITIPQGKKLSVSCPGSLPTNATGCYVYVCTDTAVAHCHLQNPFSPVLAGGTWTEPDACQLTLNDGTNISLPQSGTPLTNPQCNITNNNTGGGIVYYTRGPNSYPIMGNNVCETKDPVSGVSTCTTTYKSPNDAGSTASIEDNGPVTATIVVTTAMADTAKTCPVAGQVLTGNLTLDCFQHAKLRLRFYRGQNLVSGTVSLQNAEFANCSGTGCPAADPNTGGGANASTGYSASDTKGFQSYSLSTSFLGSLTARTFAVQGDPALAVAGSCDANHVCSGSLDGTHDAIFYQGFSCYFIRTDGEGVLYVPGSYTQWAPPIFAYGPNGSDNCQPTANQADNVPSNIYLQEGYEIQTGTAGQVGAASLATGGRNADESDMGWADIQDPNGAGILIGGRYLAPNYPKALRFQNRSAGVYNVIIALSADQTTPIQGTRMYPQAAQPDYLAWPQYQTDHVFWVFHDVCLGGGAPPCPDSGEENAFRSYQQSLVGRPALADFNRSQYFGELYPLLSPAQFNGYMNGSCAPSSCTGTPPSLTGFSLNVTVPQVIRYWTWPGTGEGFQNDLGWENTYKWLELGQPTAYIWAGAYYAHVATTSTPRADFPGGWRNVTCAGSLCANFDLSGFPSSPTGGRSSAGEYPNGGNNLIDRDWDNDVEHVHWPHIGEWTILTGNPTLRDAINQAWPDTHANTKISRVAGCNKAGACFQFARAKGQELSHAGLLYTYLQSQAFLQTGKTCATDSTTTPCVDAASAMSRATTVFNNEMAQTGSGLGFGLDFPGPAAAPSGTSKGQNPLQGWDYQFVQSGSDPDSLTTCPKDTNGQCQTDSYKSSQAFFQDMEIEGCLDADEAFGTTWSLYSACLDEAYGYGKWYYTEGGWIEMNKINGCWVGGVPINCPGTCSNAPATTCTSNAQCGTGNTCNGIGVGSLACYPGNPCSGNSNIYRDDFYNGDKPEFLFHPDDNSQWMNFAWLPLAAGNTALSVTDYKGVTVSAQSAFNEYLTLRGTTGAETGSPEENSVVGLFLNPPLTHFSFYGNPNLVSPTGQWVYVNMSLNGAAAAPSVSCTGNVACGLGWTAPANVVAYRLKVHQGVQTSIGDWDLMDPVTDPHNTVAGLGSCAAPITGYCPGTGPAGQCEIDPNTVTPNYAATKPGGQAWYGCWISDPTKQWPFFSSAEASCGATTPCNQTLAATVTSFDGTTAPGYSPTSNNSFALQAFVSTQTTQGTLIASPGTITAGQSSTLTWTASNATSASISPTVGTVCSTAATCSAGGTATVSPAATTTYSLTATGPNGSCSPSPCATATVAVTTVLPTATLSGTATITAGQSAVLTWATTNATSASINNGVGTVCATSATCNAGGTATVSPTVTTTYTLTATNGSGSTNSQLVTITVNAAPVTTGVIR